MKLRISEDLAFPLDAVTQTFGILAKRRAGKSYLTRRLAEQLHKAGAQVVIVDPKGDWWGIRSAADGKAPGLPIVIIGGERGDVKLEPGGGEVVAKLIVEEQVSALLDLSLLRKHEVATFMTGFLENLYRLKAHEKNRTPMMLIIDEADAVAPQKPQANEARMLGAAEDIVRRGGQRGIGCTVVTQRSAVLNKNILTQVQVLVALRTIAPQDLKAMDEWINVHGTPTQRETLMASLPALPVGDAWVWSPGWPTDAGIFRRIHTAPIETFDSGATPKQGERRAEPKTVAEIDLAAVSRQMAATIERAKADDPKELRRQLAEAKATIARMEKAQPAVAPPKEVSVLSKADHDRFEAAISRLEKVGREIEADGGAMASVGQNLRSTLFAAMQSLSARGVGSAQAPSAPRREASQGAGRPTKPSRSAPVVSGDVRLGPGERAILTAAAQYPGGVARDQLTVLTGYKRSSRDTYLQRLQAAGYVEPGGAGFVATAAGLAALGPDFEPLPTGDELRAYWLTKLPEGERKVLEVLVRAYPREVERTAIDEATGYMRSSRDTYLQRLASRRLVTIVGRGAVRASEELFA